MSSNDLDPARTLLERIPVVRGPCDLDLLLFFATHSSTLILSEQLARLLGYQINEIARSLEGLLTAGVLTKGQHPTRPARMYVLSMDALNGGPLAAVVNLASTREGRLALRLALAASPIGMDAQGQGSGVASTAAHAGHDQEPSR